MNIRNKISYARAMIGILHGSKAFGGPTQANINLTNRCNIRCIHCWDFSPLLTTKYLGPVSNARLEDNEFISTEELEQIQNMDIEPDLLYSLLDELLNSGTRCFILTGGEPFLHENMMECVSRLKGAGCFCLANTNGTLLDKDTTDELIKVGFDELRVNTMAVKPDEYNRVHPGTSTEIFEIFKNNLLYLNKMKKRLGKRNPKVIMAFTITTENAVNIMDFAKFAVQVGADTVSFRPVYDMEDQGLTSLVPSERLVVSVLEQLAKVEDYLESKGIPHNIKNFRLVFKGKLDTTAIYQVTPCYYTWLAICVNPDGGLFPCGKSYPSIGNLYKESFQKIWYGAAYQNFRKEALRINQVEGVVHGCDCNSCVHYTANLRVYKALHPFKRCFR